jgi:hypothetical protein
MTGIKRKGLALLLVRPCRIHCDYKRMFLLILCFSNPREPGKCPVRFNINGDFLPRVVCQGVFVDETICLRSGRSIERAFHEMEFAVKSSCFGSLRSRVCRLVWEFEDVVFRMVCTSGTGARIIDARRVVSEGRQVRMFMGRRSCIGYGKPGEMACGVSAAEQGNPHHASSIDAHVPCGAACVPGPLPMRMVSTAADP